MAPLPETNNKEFKMKKTIIVKFLCICALLAAGMLYAFARSGGPTAPKNTRNQGTIACCNETKSGGLTGCTKPYYETGPDGRPLPPKCVGGMKKALCDSRYNNCTEHEW